MSHRNALIRLALVILFAAAATRCAFLSDVVNTPVQQQPAFATNTASCTGIEMMGLYKNQIFDPAMGGGMVEWLAKIRNNTGVTKIINFAWRDSNGQQQRSQVELQAGQIASPRVDLTQARAIPPVTELRLLSCE